MKKLLRLFSTALLLSSLFTVQLNGQGEFDHATRALYIFDIARYVEYGDALNKSAMFKIGVLDKRYELYNEMAKMGQTRKQIQGKPVSILVFREEEKIEQVHILYVHKESGFNLDKVKALIKGKPVLLITEGYKFRESMLNFIVVSGRPRFEVNEEELLAAGLKVSELFLAQAIKTREDWEKLFDQASEELEIQKEIVRQQQETIDRQKEEILAQKALLDSLDKEIDLKEATLLAKQKQLNSQQARIDRQGKEITGQKNLIATQQKEVEQQLREIASQREEIGMQESMIIEKLNLIEQQDERILVQVEAIEKQKIVIWAGVAGFLLLAFLAYYIYRGYRIKKQANIELEKRNKTILKQKDEIEKQRDLAASQRDLILYQKKHITDSIMYAKRIQTALLPSLELFSDRLEHFVLYRPLDIVSGDFYWVSENGKNQVIIAADCTGHGVPGAFMSMLGVTMLNEIVNGKKITAPDQILNRLRDGIVRTLNQSVEEDRVKDGMDMAICNINLETGELLFAGANNPLYVVRNKELVHYRGDKMPVAIHYIMNPFTLHQVQLEKGDCVYIFSDGYADQFGGRDQKKFMTGKLKQTLAENSHLPMLRQGEKLSEIFDEWKGDNSQVDDVVLIGFRY